MVNEQPCVSEPQSWKRRDAHQCRVGPVACRSRFALVLKRLIQLLTYRRQQWCLAAVLTTSINAGAQAAYCPGRELLSTDVSPFRPSCEPSKCATECAAGAAESCASLALLEEARWKLGRPFVESPHLKTACDLRLAPACHELGIRREDDARTASAEADDETAAVRAEAKRQRAKVLTAEAEAWFLKACQLGDGAACVRASDLVGRHNPELACGMVHSQVEANCALADGAACGFLAEKAFLVPAQDRNSQAALTTAQRACGLGNQRACRLRLEHADEIADFGERVQALGDGCEAHVPFACETLLRHTAGSRDERVLLKNLAQACRAEPEMARCTGEDGSFLLLLRQDREGRARQPDRTGSPVPEGALTANEIVDELCREKMPAACAYKAQQAHILKRRDARCALGIKDACPPVRHK